MPQRSCHFIILCSIALMVLGCLAQPEQPSVTQPHALLVLPAAIRLVALDTQTLDPRVRLGEVRLTPGLHTLRFSYAGSSPQHAGQGGDPLQFQVQAGHQYVFEAKT